jgi:hypothetical protein
MNVKMMLHDPFYCGRTTPNLLCCHSLHLGVGGGIGGISSHDISPELI